MPIGPARMPFFDHIAELRKRLGVVAILVFVGSILAYFYADVFFAFLMKPVKPILEGQKFVVTAPFEAFAVKFKVGLYATLALGSPIIIWQFMAFFLPALKPRERRWFVPIFFAMLFFFAAGMVFCYLYAIPSGFKWLVEQGGETMSQLPKASDWVNAVALFMLGFGIGFQTPVIVFGLVGLGIVPYAAMRRNWRTVWVVLLIVASIATPDWSPVNMLALFGAMLALYEGSLLVVRVVFSKRIAEQRAEAAAAAEG